MSMPPSQGNPAHDDLGAPRRAGAAAMANSRSHSDEPTRVSDSDADGFAGSPADEHPQIDGYRIHEELHRGGQGIVYRATQLAFKREVALKVLLEGPFAGESARLRFEREIELAASLQHPNIVTILDSGMSRGRCYFAMEYVDGQRLDQFLRERLLTLRDTLELLRQIAETVHFAHQRGVIHRDLKPSNILIDDTGQPRILDFGLAKVTGEGDPYQTTIQMVSTTGQVIGTLAYMSPEQAAGSADVDIRSDVYSLGVIFYEALLQTTPYPVAGPLGEVLLRIANDEPTRPRSMRGGSRFGKQIDDELETILLKTLEKEPARRYQTALDLARDLRHYLNGDPIEAKRASGLYMLRKTLRRYRWQAGAAATLLMVLVVFTVIVSVQWHNERDLRAQAAAAAAIAQEQAELAAEAESRERDARQRAETNERAAIDAAERAREALVRQMVQRGNLAWVSGDLGAARDSFWEAYLDGADKAAAVWALRQYYLDSGDSGAVQLFQQSYGPTALSPDGSLAATCDSPNGISLRDCRTGQTDLWVRTPGVVLAVSVSNDGRIAACGDAWACVWPKTAHTPIVEAQWSGQFEPSWIHELDGGASLLLVGDNTLALFSSADGHLISRGVLQAPRLGAPRLSPDESRLYVPTRAGVEMVSLRGSDALQPRVWWSAAGRAAPRAVEPLGDGRIAVLADAIYAAPIDASSADEWTTLASLSGEFDILRVDESGTRIIVASHDGRLSAIEAGVEMFSWRVGAAGLLDVRFDNDAPAVTTLAKDGALTRWVTPEDAQERRLIFTQPVRQWAVAEEAAAMVLAAKDGSIAAFAPALRPEPFAVELPSLLRAFGARSTDDIVLAIDGAGDSALIQSGGRIWRRELDRPRSLPTRWRGFRDLSVAGMALSFDGRISALYAQSEARDRQLVAFRPMDLRDAVSDSDFSRANWRPTEFIGSTIRIISFLPHTYTLVVARSNGALVMLDPPADTPPATPRDRTLPWYELESPAYRIALSRDGVFLAAACDDGLVRVLNVLDVGEVGRFAAPERVDALSFDVRGDVLLARGADGSVELRDMNGLDRILTWEFPCGDEPALAAWLGEGDLILSDARGVVSIEFHEIDERIRRGEAFALARECLRRSGDGDAEGAWRSATQLRFTDETAGREAQLALLERALRRRGRSIPDDWIDAVSANLDRSALLRLSHAAFDGGRFAPARSWLAAAGADAVADTDVYTHWRAAECELLHDDYSAAIGGLTALLAGDQLLHRDRARARLELLAAYVLSDQPGEACACLADMQKIGRHTGGDETAGSMAALLIGRYLLGEQTESQVNAAFGAFLNVFKDQWLEYRDDVEFFAGELARKGGDLPAAAGRYQLCIDVAVDAWPADWARHRLEQMRALPADRMSQ